MVRYDPLGHRRPQDRAETRMRRPSPRSRRRYRYEAHSRAVASARAADRAGRRHRGGETITVDLTAARRRRPPTMWAPHGPTGAFTISSLSRPGTDVNSARSVPDRDHALHIVNANPPRLRGMVEVKYCVETAVMAPSPRPSAAGRRATRRRQPLLRGRPDPRRRDLHLLRVPAGGTGASRAATATTRCARGWRAT